MPMLTISGKYSDFDSCENENISDYDYVPVVGNKVFMSECPEDVWDYKWGEDGPYGTVTEVYESSNKVVVTVQYGNVETLILFEIDGSSWNDCYEWKRYSWSYNSLCLEDGKVTSFE